MHCGHHRVEMRATRNLGHDTAETGVLLDAASDRVRKQRVAAHDANAGLVARRLDAENESFSHHESEPSVGAHFDTIDAREVEHHQNRVGVARLVVALANADLLEAEPLIHALRDLVVGAHLEADHRFVATACFVDQRRQEPATDAVPCRSRFTAIVCTNDSSGYAQRPA